ncbi:hypothetical protein BGZ60DRAFT_413490, partial [Tricladium varicosporioides]
MFPGYIDELLHLSKLNDSLATPLGPLRTSPSNVSQWRSHSYPPTRYPALAPRKSVHVSCQLPSHSTCNPGYSHFTV